MNPTPLIHRAFVVYITAIVFVLWVFALPSFEWPHILLSSAAMFVAILLTRTLMFDTTKEEWEKIFLYYWWKQLFKHKN